MEHPCDLCTHGHGFGIGCPSECAFYSWNSGYCNNYNCTYHNSDIACQWAKKCGAYIGGEATDLDFDDEEDTK